MADVRDLLTSTTPDRATLPDVDYDAVAARGSRRRTAKRIGAAALSLALLGGAVVVVVDAVTAPDVSIVGEDPADVTWESLPPAPVGARSIPTVGALPDGRVVVVGGLLPAADGSVTFATDGALLDADRTGWVSLPPVPFDNATGRGVDFAVRDEALWAYRLGMVRQGEPAGVTDLQVARLDLAAVDADWEVLPPVDVGDGFPTVTVVGDTVVVLAGDAADGGRDSGFIGTGLTPFATSGAIWRGGAWTTFDAAPLPPVADPFLGVGPDHVAVVGGTTPGGTTAAAAVLDLGTATWTAAPDHPGGPRTQVRAGVNSLVTGGRMLAAGGIAERGDGFTDEPAAGAAWLDLAGATWEEVPLPYATAPFPVGPDSMTPPVELQLPPVVASVPDADLVRVDPSGAIVPAVTGPEDLPTQHVEYVEGAPVLAIGHHPGPGEPTRAALATGTGGWVEVTLDHDLQGVTYRLVGGGLLAAGGVPYEPGASGAVGDVAGYDLDGPLRVWRLGR